MADLFRDCVLSLSEAKTARDALLDKRKKIISFSGITDAAKGIVSYAMSADFSRRLIICSDSKRAKERAEEYLCFDKNVLYFPSKDLLFYESDLRSNSITKERVNVLSRLLSDERLTVFAGAEALLNRLSKKEEFKRGFLSIEVGATVEEDALLLFLVKNGYESVAEVEGPGEFAKRGGIVDVFALSMEHPVRIEFFGDEIDSIRLFDIASQKSIEKIEGLTICPAGEFVLSNEQRAEGKRNLLNAMKERYEEFYGAQKTEEAFRVKQRMAAIDDSDAYSIEDAVIETYLPYFPVETVSLLDWFSEDDLVIIDEPARIEETLTFTAEEFSEATRRRIETGDSMPLQKDLIFSDRDIISRLNGKRALALSMLDFTGKKGGLDISARFFMHTEGVVYFRRDFPLFLKEVQKYKKNKWKTVVVCPSRTRAKKLAEDMRDNDVICSFTEDREKDMVDGEVVVTVGGLISGAVFDSARFVFISENDIFGRLKSTERRRIKRFTGGERLRSIRDLSIGDYVVHEDYGLGIYDGMEKIEAMGIVKDCIKISYAKGDTLYIPATQFDRIGKYTLTGEKGTKPKLNSLSSREWGETKARVRAAVTDVAKDLVSLYAARQNEKGFAYSKDGPMQREFEDTFPYEETESQIAAIEEVKKDMESVKIMDRLICGDVGFGKTEVALRAAMKAVIDGKQVVYLCPTTILAEQHYNTFRERMEPFAVSVSMMSRFRTDAENKKTAKELSDGTCDVVIGTHRVLSKDVSFKNLGLLIIDEEQRFGVRHKETIKKLRRNVDVLSLSATPIPRTLHMSLVGIRDMSLLSEAPEERLPIQTFVMERSPEIVREAIERELSRGGQVYYVINRIRDIADVADKIKELVPNASVEYAHGRMPETVLENIMSDFINRRIDVLVSTTIIEIGLDISNVNTIIIHDSDRLGLSQLYQLRGRVGRSNRTAYAFLMYTKDKMLKEVAEKRLSAIREFTELGSGFKVAMRDLEIRGAGNLLGEAQSGHMAAVGYDLYVKMLSEAVAMEKGEGEASYFDTSIDLSVDAFIPDNYIKDSGQKLEAYKRIAGIRSEDDKSEVVDELIDRFGDIPGEVMMLMEIAILRTRAHEAYVTSLKQIGKVFRFILYEKAALDVARIPELLEKNAPYLSFEPDPKKPALEFDAGKNNRLSKEDIDAVPWKIVDELVELKV